MLRATYLLPYCGVRSPGAPHGEWTESDDDRITLKFNCRWPEQQGLHPCVFRRRPIVAGQEPEKFFGEDDKGYKVELTHLGSYGMFPGGWRDIPCM